MNINDVTKIDYIEGDKLEAIFHRQRELMEKYHPIEAKNGLLLTNDIPVNLHDSKGQARLKDFAWRTVEEIAEALEAQYHTNHSKEHLKEELVDALHFLVEMSILAGITPYDIVKNLRLPDYVEGPADYLDQLCSVSNIGMMIKNSAVDFIIFLGMTCNTLKNKPWKQTQMMTDTDKFKSLFIKAFHRFIDIMVTADMESQEIYDIYFKKSEVNKFRQRSNY